MEASTAAERTSRAVDADTITEAFGRTAVNHADRVAVRTKDDSVSLTWGQLKERVDAVAGGLAALGVERGDVVALMMGNRPEFHIVDLAVVMLGATPFSIYQTFPPEEIEYVVSDAGAKVAIVEQGLLTPFLKAREQLPAVEHVVVVDGDAPDGTVPLADVEGSNPGFDVAAPASRARPDDILTLIYTSGTTGPPKGVQLTHANIIATTRLAQEIIDFPEETHVISWLPAAHVAERSAHHYMPIVYAFTVTTCENGREIMSYLPAVRPNWFFAVPRIWEKLKAGLETMLASRPEAERAPMEAALKAARERLRLEQAGEPVPPALAEQVAKADEQYFAGLRAMLGLDRVVTVNVGAAPTPREVLEFFHAIGIELAELWGMSETCGAGTVNPPGRVRIGTVGPPEPGIEITLADDGEVLVRGPIVMAGYRNAPEKTAEAIDADGWLHSGDIGEFDEAGYLRIVDRKKELIINAAGKNMSPANIESALKGASPLIGQACAIGDLRPYNTALVVLDPDFAPSWASQHGLEGRSFEELAHEPAMIEAVQEGVDAANATLARVEGIKKFTIVEGDWAPGGDELTPTMKLKRKPIARKYADDIEAMYGG